MSIPKKIHYCWFGRNPLPESAKKCIESWKKYCPEYEIIEWNEDNFDLTENRYAREAYEQKKWAFVSDYARLKIVYEQGGIYMDVDVELIKPLDGLTELDGYMGFEKEIDGQMWIATGLGFGARAGHPIVGALLKDYEDIPFIKEDGRLDTESCPGRNTRTLRTFVLSLDNTKQEIDGIVFLPTQYLAPVSYFHRKKEITEHTVSIHHYDGSWLNEKEQKSLRLRRLLGNRLYHRLQCLWYKINPRKKHS